MSRPSGYLTENCKIFIATTTTLGAAGTSTITSTAVDTAGYDGCCFIVPLGTIVSGSVTSIKLTQCDTTGGSYADLTGSNIAVLDTEDDGLRYIDIVRPQEQFLKVVVTRTTQNATIGGIVAILYGARKRPATHGSGVTGEQWSGPAEGTA